MLLLAQVDAEAEGVEDPCLLFGPAPAAPLVVQGRPVKDLGLGLEDLDFVDQNAESRELIRGVEGLELLFDDGLSLLDHVELMFEHVEEGLHLLPPRWQLPVREGREDPGEARNHIIHRRLTGPRCARRLAHPGRLADLGRRCLGPGTIGHRAVEEHDFGPINAGLVEHLKDLRLHCR